MGYSFGYRLAQVYQWSRIMMSVVLNAVVEKVEDDHVIVHVVRDGYLERRIISKSVLKSEGISEPGQSFRIIITGGIRTNTIDGTPVLLEPTVSFVNTSDLDSSKSIPLFDPKYKPMVVDDKYKHERLRNT